RVVVCWFCFILARVSLCFCLTLRLPPSSTLFPYTTLFRSGDSSKKFKIAEGQWYRYAPSYVSPAYHLLEGFPFIQEGEAFKKVKIGRAVQQECRDRSRMPSSA